MCGGQCKSFTLLRSSFNVVKKFRKASQQIELVRIRMIALNEINCNVHELNVNACDFVVILKRLFENDESHNWN